MKKLFTIVVPLILCFCLLPVYLASCKKPPPVKPQKPAFADVIASFDAAPSKSGTINADCTMTLYSNGGPLNIIQNLIANRTQSNGYYLMDLDVSTGEISNEILNLINLAELGGYDFSRIRTYLTGDLHGAIKGGYYNGTYNVKGDIVNAGEEPDYLYTGKDNITRSSFAGFAESEMQEYLAYLGYQDEAPFSLKDYLMFLQLKSIDWANCPDEIGGDLSAEDDKFHYRFTLPGETVKASIFGIAEALAARFAASEDKDIQKLLGMYTEYKAFVSNLLTFAPSVISAVVNKDGMIERLSHESKITLKIADSQILDLIKDEEEKEKIAGMLQLLHLLITTSNAEEGKIEITFSLNTYEDFVYGDAAAVDTADDIFASAEQEAAGRTLFGCVYKQNKCYFSKLPDQTNPD